MAEARSEMATLAPTLKNRQQTPEPPPATLRWRDLNPVAKGSETDPSEAVVQSTRESETSNDITDEHKRQTEY